MSVDSVEWLSNSVLHDNVEYSRRLYKFLEESFSTCTEYVALHERHLGVYSFRLSDLILRIGPEILKAFNLIIFNQRRSELFHEQSGLEKKIVDIQEKKKTHRDNFIDYLDAVSVAKKCKLGEERIELKALPKFIVPFELEKRVLKNGKSVNVVFWWEDGYNALRHRAIEEFVTSATLRNALFSLGALWVLHNILDFDWGRPGLAESEFFNMPFTFRPTRSKAEKLK
ncbi:hypothetical protein MUP59_11060 [Candidatus Bathyarchaeota archaeon]|nr:hypothetical protein [Candidatus Bathyarchaeota archaeon]